MARLMDIDGKSVVNISVHVKWSEFQGHIFGQNIVFDEGYVNAYWLRFPPANNFVHIFIVITIGIILLASTLGNGLVIVTCLKFRNLNLANTLILNLSLADTLCPLMTYWMYIVSSFNGIWAFGKTGCMVYGFLQGLFGLTSLVNISVISVCYCLKIFHSHFSSNVVNPRKQVCSMERGSISCIWLYCATLAILPLLGYSNYSPYGFLTNCCFDYLSRNYETRTFLIILFSFGFVVPMSAIIISYVIILYVVRKATQRTNFRSGNEPKNYYKRIKYDMKVLKIMFVVIVAFLIAWLPFASVSLIGQFGPENLITPLMATIPALFAKTSSVYNPIIYAYMDTRFRSALYQVCFGSRSS